MKTTDFLRDCVTLIPPFPIDTHVVLLHGQAVCAASMLPPQLPPKVSFRSGMSDHGRQRPGNSVRTATPW
jgi:hypothetical protein